MEGIYKFDCFLLVDDDPITNFINERLISGIKLCAKIEIADDAEKALQFILSCYIPEADQKTLLILIDLNMPVWDGFEFLNELESRTELPFDKIDVIILSSSLLRTDTERAKKYRILDYIAKPLTLEKLMASIRKKYNE